MKGTTLVAAILILVLAVFMTAAAQDDADAAGSYTVNVYIDDGESVTKMSGTGTDIVKILENAVESAGHTVDIGSVRVNSVDGVVAPDGKAWTVQQWQPPRGWETIIFHRASATLVNGTSYCICLSDASFDASTQVTTYSVPSFEPQATGYFFIKFVEDSEANSDVNSVLTKGQRENGFWISGTGSNLAWAFKDACENYGLELDMSNGVKGNIVDPDYIGWLNSFFGLKDELMSGDTNTGNWKYWSQFYWDDGRWVYSQTLGHYDPAVNPYFALIRQITTKDNVTPNVGTTPSDAPLSEMRNGCTVKFVDGDGRVVKTQTVPYFGDASAPEYATKSPSAEHSYEFKGWNGVYHQVISDITVTAEFAEITNVRVTGISITDSKDSVPAGLTYRFAADVLPSDATLKGIKWSVGDSTVASIDSDGTLRALKAGSTTVTATSVDGGFSDTVTVTVTGQTDKVWSVKISGVPPSIEIGKVATLKADIEPAGAKDKKVSWTSSDESVAKIDQNGIVTALKAGSVDITVTTNDGGYTDTVTIVITPSSDSVWSVEIDGGDREIVKGDSLKLSAKILPVTAKDKTVTWSVSDTSIASIDGDGVITGKRFGTTTVEVRTADGGHIASIDVKVVPGPGQAAYVTIDEGDLVLEKDSSSGLTANVDPDAKKKEVRWSSEDESIAKVDSKGIVTAISPGTTRIIVEVIDGGATGSCEVRVYSMDDVSQVSEDRTEVDDGASSSTVDKSRAEALVENDSSYTMKTDGLGTVTLSSEILSKLSSKGAIRLSVKTLTAADLGDWNSAQKAVLGDRQAFEYTIDIIDSKEGVSDLFGKATVSVPYVLRDGELPEDLKVFYVDYNGGVEEFPCTYDADACMATFETTHFSLYFVAAEKKESSEQNESGSNILPIAAVGIIIILAVCAIAYVRMRGRI